MRRNMLIGILLAGCIYSTGAQQTPAKLKGPCELPEKNISFNALSLPYYQGFGRLLNTSIKVYLSLCKPLRDLPVNISSLCDPSAFSCITKLNDSGDEVKFIRNSGSSTAGLHSEGSHLGMRLEGGAQCGTNDSVSTRIDFFCSSYLDLEDNSIRYEGQLGVCEHQIFWHTSLACLPELSNLPVASSCIIKVPGYDAIIDIGVWASSSGHFTARFVDQTFHLNLCTGISNSPCPNSSILCLVDGTETKMLTNLLNYTDRHSLTYQEEGEIISLFYQRPRGSVSIYIECDRDSSTPLALVDHSDDTRTVLRMKTVSACLVPPVQCVAQDKQKNLYDLSSLKTVEWEIGVANEKQTRYQIKVCGSLPITPDNPCNGQAGICTYRFKENTTYMEDVHNLGIMYKRPTVSEEGDITLEYSHGSPYTDDKGNSCNMSAEIILRCSDRELGPRFEEATACRHTLVWSTPGACAQQRLVSRDCTVREPLFSNLFNITALYNSTQDYHVVGEEEEEYILNVCGPLLSSCRENQTCLQTEQNLSYLDGSLEMLFVSSPCKSEPTRNLNARIVFLCNQEIEVGAPELVLEDGCELQFEWRTNLACPPHQMVQCSVTTQEGLIDLSELSLPHQNYEVLGDPKDVFLLNICRSLVHTNQSKCPYQSAACLLNSGEAVDINLGEVHSGVKLNEDGLPFITYTLGSLCKDAKSNLGHIQTTITFLCNPEAFNSEPDFLEVSDCHYIFEWTHAAACPTRTSMGNCSVTSPESGFTFDLRSLNRPEGWHFNETSQHWISHLDLNVCGPLQPGICGQNVTSAGACNDGKINMGQANSNLTFSWGQLMLVYSGGECPGEPEVPAETRVRFYCPARRMSSSGNVERDGPKSLRVSRDGETCHVVVDFITDLACDHQVYCDVNLEDGSVLPLTKLRRHDHNYKTKDRDGNPFYLNICGPLVATDVPMSACNPQGVCGLYGGRYVGMGKVLSSPELVANGHVEVRYEDGDICEPTGGTWSSRIFFTCIKAVDKASPFGAPRLVSLDNTTCEAVFTVATILACNDTTRDVKVVEPDSCDLYHPGKSRYISLRPLMASKSYQVRDPAAKSSQEYYDIQPCGSLASSCRGSVCKVTGFQNFSLGTLNDVKYSPDRDELRVRYIEGDVCDSNTNQRFASKIYFRCDPRVAGAGSPELAQEGVLDCLVIFNWRSSQLCDQEELQLHAKNKPDKTIDIDISEKSAPNVDVKESPVTGGGSWGHLALAVLLILAVLCVVYFYRRPQAREKAGRACQEFRARLPICLGGRSRDDSSLLISGLRSNGSFLNDDDDYS